MERENGVSEEEALFVQLVLMFQAAAMQQMGKLPNPISQKTETNLEQAKFSVDILDMIKGKTKGNLSSEEEGLLEHVLYELRMNYLEELRKKEKPSQESDCEDGTS